MCGVRVQDLACGGRHTAISIIGDYIAVTNQGLVSAHGNIVSIHGSHETQKAFSNREVFGEEVHEPNISSKIQDTQYLSPKIDQDKEGKRIKFRKGSISTGPKSSKIETHVTSVFSWGLGRDGQLGFLQFLFFCLIYLKLVWGGGYTL